MLLFFNYVSDMAKDIVTDNSWVSQNPFRHTWFSIILYSHVIFLYVLIYSLYSELQQVKQNLYDINDNFVNITTKEIQLQMKFLQGVPSQVCSENSQLNRTKREIFLNNRTRLEFGSYTRKSTIRNNGNPDHEKRNHSERRGKKFKKKNRRKRGHGKHRQWA